MKNQLHKMKVYNLFITTFLALNIVGCGDSQKDKEGFFSFDESALKSMYKANDKVDFTLVNNENKTIDSIVYFANNERITSVKGNGKFTLDLGGKKLGYHNIKALVYFEGDTISTQTRVEVAAANAPKLLKYTVINTYDHDVNAFTQGYEFYNDTLIESTGREGTSYVAKTDYKTGKTYKKTDLNRQYFGEGITVLNDKIYQLTWQNAEGFIYDAKTLKLIKSFQYDKKIEEKNQELETPLKMEETQKEQEGIDKDLKESSDQLGKKQNKKASQKQKEASEKMEELAEKMEKSLDEAQEQQEEEGRR